MLWFATMVLANHPVLYQLKRKAVGALTPTASLEILPEQQPLGIAVTGCIVLAD